MKLNLALQSDMGDAVTTEGMIGYVGKPANITGSKNGKAYDFWSQFVTIGDETGTVGVGLSFNTKDECITEQQKGGNIKIKGTMGSYVKDGKTVLKIDRAKLVSPPLASQSANKASNIDTQTAIIRQAMCKAAAEFYSKVAKRTADAEGRDATDVVIAAKLFEGYVLGNPKKEPLAKEPLENKLADAEPALDVDGEPVFDDDRDFSSGNPDDIPF